MYSFSIIYLACEKYDSLFQDSECPNCSSKHTTFPKFEKLRLALVSQRKLNLPEEDTIIWLCGNGTPVSFVPSFVPRSFSLQSLIACSMQIWREGLGDLVT